VAKERAGVGRVVYFVVLESGWLLPSCVKN